MIDQAAEKCYALYAQKEAEQMTHEIIYPRKDRVIFVVITPGGMPTECVWLDPYMGMFAIKGREEEGFIRVDQLPSGTLFVNQRYESEDGE